MGNCKGKLSKESKNQMRGEAYRPSKPDTQGKETIHVEGKPVIKNDNGEDAVVINAKIPFVNPETPTKSESVMQGPNTSVSDTNGLKESESTGKQDQKLHESDAFPEKPNEKQNKNVLSSANIENNSGEETNLKEAPPTGITLNKVPDYKSDDAEIEKPGYLFSQGCKGEEAQTEDSGFTDKITGLKVPLPTDQSSSSHDTVPTEKAKDEDKNLTKVDDNVPTKKASGNVSEPTVENKSNQSNEHKDDSTEKTSDKLQPGSTPSDKLQSGNTPSDKLQLGNTSDNQQNKNDSTGYNHSKFSNPCDEQDKKMSKEMKEIDGKKKKKKKKKPDKYGEVMHIIDTMPE
ncbi:myb-like protein V [Mytilus trossulus]|uniref:myb-like protein V n=1 Tax=Mytilus trossulus TaxID=6551 RepID=UPI003004FB89